MVDGFAVLSLWPGSVSIGWLLSGRERRYPGRRDATERRRCHEEPVATAATTPTRVALACALLACGLFAACVSRAPTSGEPPGSGPAADSDGRAEPSELEVLAEDALQRGDLALADKRFRRVLNASPRSLRARAGVGRVALERGEVERAREQFARVLAADPDWVDALLGMAEVERRAGDRAAARRHLDRAVASDSARSDAHARLAELTGPAPRSAAPSVDQALRLAQAHPYDPWALLHAAEALLRRGNRDAAIGTLEKVVWLADLDPPSATTALRMLSTLQAGWGQRRVVHVHAYADEPIRSRVGWRFQLRTLWLTVSNALSNIVDTQFVPISIGAFRSEGASNDLDSIVVAFERSVGRVPRRGILAAFTGRPLPERRGGRKNGLAVFLGRRLTVRVEPGSVESRVLAHEILHLYGAIHVVQDVDSLMNPTGESLVLDRASYRIVQAIRPRAFRDGGLERDILPWIDLGETIEAYKSALSVNLRFRELGIAQALETRRLSRYQAAAEARQAVRMDPHLADAARMVAMLMRADKRQVEAVALLEAAATLYGMDTRRGRETFEEAQRLRQYLLWKHQIE
jgi:tetratricopeptide (TPR) repeat protein